MRRRETVRHVKAVPAIAAAACPAASLPPAFKETGRPSTTHAGPGAAGQRINDNCLHFGVEVRVLRPCWMALLVGECLVQGFAAVDGGVDADEFQCAHHRVGRPGQAQPAPVLPVARAADVGRMGQHGLEIVMAVAQGFRAQRESVGKRISVRIALLDRPGTPGRRPER